MKASVLLEIPDLQENAFSLFDVRVQSENESLRASEQLVSDLSGYGLEVLGDFAPIPMFSSEGEGDEILVERFSGFNVSQESPDTYSSTTVVACIIDSSRLEALTSEHQEIKVWPNSELTLFNSFGRDVVEYNEFGTHPLDLASSRGGTDCRPFRAGVGIDVIRELLAVDRVWRDGFRGQNIVVGIIDEGVNGQVYPVVGGFSNNNAVPPGSAAITSHGSMCAADILIAAPAVKLYDYPFLGVPNSGGALRMFQAVLEQRRIDGTPHITNNSYGFTGIPHQQLFPNHEIFDLNHPLHRKVREVVASGTPAFFAAGNCGEPCPSGACFPSGIGPNKSIHASNSLKEVITVAAVNSRHEHIGYSSQGPGLFEAGKPDIASYSHIFGNFGPNRPGGLAQPFDNGTSAATPVAAGVGALLMSAISNLTPDKLKAALVQSAIDIGQPRFDHNTGHGVINAATAYALLLKGN